MRSPLDLSCRTPTPADFGSFFDNFYSRYRGDRELRGAVAHEWYTLLESPTTISLVVEGMVSGAVRGVVGCAQLAFVSEEFMRWVRRAKRPWVNAMATRTMPDGSWPLVTPEEARCAQNGEGLSALITRWGRADVLRGREARQVNTYMDARFQELTEGYPFRELLVEPIGQVARRLAKAAGFEERSDYGDFYQANPPLPSEEAHPYLMGITRDEADAKEGCRIAHFFCPLPPWLGLTAGERDLLDHARYGETNEELAKSLRISLSAVQKRWTSIYSKAQEILPGLFPDWEDRSEEKSRGSEKRRRLLRYLHEHPEELRTPGPG